MSDGAIHRGIISGRMPGEKEWSLYFLELTSTHLHIFEGREQSSLSRKHIKSTEIRGSDEVNEKKATKKNIFKFYLLNADGKYIFQCGSEDERDKWVRRITKVRNQRTMECGLTSSVSGPVISKPAYGKGKRVVDQRLAQPPTNGGSRNSRSSVSSTDSGFGPSTDGEVSRQPFVTVETKKSLSTPSSADGKLKYGKQQKGHSDGGCFEGRGNQNGHENMHNYSWFWDTLSRTETENKLQTEGKVGNFVVRINAEGSYVMSVWRADAVHHYKISHTDSLWKFERAAIEAEGHTLVDLLDTYMKSCTDKSVAPFGDGLHLVYDEPWTPPEIDMEQLSERLREEFTKSTTVQSSTSRNDPDKKIRPAPGAMANKTSMVPQSRQSSSLPHSATHSSKAVQPETSRATSSSPIHKSDSGNKLNSSMQQLLISPKPQAKPKLPPVLPPVAATVVDSESEDGVYQNWTSSPPQDETSKTYENWTAEEQQSPGSTASPVEEESSEQVYQNTAPRAPFKPQVPQKPLSKR